MQLQSLGYRTDLMLLRLQGSVVEDGSDHLVVRTLANPGFHWGNFVLADQSWVDRPLADLVAVFHAEHPAAGHVAIGVDGVDGRVWGKDELGECGLEVERSVVMTATEVHAPLHPNTEAECRMLASDTDWAAAVDIEHGDADPAEYRDFGQRRMAVRRAQQEAGLGAWFGAFVEGEMLCGLGTPTTRRSGSTGRSASRTPRSRSSCPDPTSEEPVAGSTACAETSEPCTTTSHPRLTTRSVLLRCSTSAR